MRRSDQRGATAILMAFVICFVTIPLASLAVDLGKQRIARRDVQAVADTVALDMARLIGTSTPPTDLLAQRAYRDRDVVGHSPVLKVFQGYIASGATWVSDQSLGCGGSPYNSYFASVPAGKTANAVLVTASGGVDFDLSGVLPGAPSYGGVCRSSIASAVSSTCFTVGSMVGALDGTSGLVGLLNSVLDPHGTINVGLVGYQGLAHAYADLGLLDRALVDLGHPAGVLATDVRVGDLLKAAASALVQGSATVSLDATATVLNAMARATVLLNAPVTVATKLATGLAPPVIVDLSTQQGAVLTGRVDVLDLISSAVMIADGDHLLAASLPVSVPGLANLTTTATLIESGRTSCGVAGAQARTAQAKVSVSGTLLPGPSSGHPDGGAGLSLNGGALLPGLNLNVWVNQVKPTLVLQTATAAGSLGSVTCGPDVIPVNVRTGLLQLSLSAPVTLAPSSLDITGLITIGGIPVLQALTGVSIKVYVGDEAHWDSTGQLRGITVPVGLTAGQPADQVGTDLTWQIGAGDTYGSVKSTGPSAQTLPHLGSVALPGNAIWIDVRGQGLLGALLTPVSTLLNGLLSTLQTALQTAVNGLVVGSVNTLVDTLNPVLQQVQGLVGLRLAGADVTVLPEASCGKPVSRG